MKEQLVTHVENLTSNQRSHIPKPVLQILDADKDNSSSVDDPSATYSTGDKRKRKNDSDSKTSSKKKLLS